MGPEGVHWVQVLHTHSFVPREGDIQVFWVPKFSDWPSPVCLSH